MIFCPMVKFLMVEKSIRFKISFIVIAKVKITFEELTSHLRDQRRGEILRDGCRIAILGAPNAGKVCRSDRHFRD